MRLKKVYNPGSSLYVGCFKDEVLKGRLLWNILYIPNDFGVIPLGLNRLFH